MPKPCSERYTILYDTKVFSVYYRAQIIMHGKHADGYTVVQLKTGVTDWPKGSQPSHQHLLSFKHPPVNPMFFLHMNNILPLFLWYYLFIFSDFLPQTSISYIPNSLKIQLLKKMDNFDLRKKWFWKTIVTETSLKWTNQLQRVTVYRHS